MNGADALQPRRIGTQPQGWRRVRQEPQEVLTSIPMAIGTGSEPHCSFHQATASDQAASGES